MPMRYYIEKFKVASVMGRKGKAGKTPPRRIRSDVSLESDRSTGKKPCNGVIEA
jgi:hypothetical protein